MTRPFTAHIEGLGPVEIVRSPRAKRLRLSVRPFRGARVTVPEGVSLTQALDFAASEAPWLARTLRRTRGHEMEALARMNQKPPLDRQTARRHLAARLDALAARHGLPYRRLSIRRQRARWGSCSAGNDISLNERLLFLPDDLVTLVLLHELVHTRIKNHGPAFWAELERLLPGARALTGRLRGYSAVLSCPGPECPGPEVSKSR